MTTLLHAVRRYAEAHANADRLAQTPIPGLRTVRATAPSGLLHAVSRPLVCLVVQGSKQVTMGTQAFSFSARRLAADHGGRADRQPDHARQRRPRLISRWRWSSISPSSPSSSAQMGAERVADHAPVRVDPTDAEVADAALRLMRLLDRPASVPVLQAQLVREMHYWLLAGKHGSAIRRLGWPDGHVQRVARAVAVLRAEFAQPLPVERLAAMAGMSPSSFHQHFRAVTSLSPLQFQKQLRLIEARRLMMSDGASASSAAFAVGYESVSQFTREYGRLFGLPPVKDMRAARRMSPDAVAAA